MALTTEQLMLLNNIVYEDEAGIASCATVGEYIAKLNPEAAVGALVSADEWSAMIQAIKNDSTLCEMKIAAVHSRSDSRDGVSVVFLDESSGEAVVSYRGTDGGEQWADNFESATGTDLPDGVSTQSQVNALDWYKQAYKELGLENYEVTVTGHSKGGNSAQYVALLDDSVSRCVSFDGEGFSDEFMLQYAVKINANEGKISNHCVKGDYVNILLNDVGKNYYYDGNGVDTFLENHAPNSFFHYDENGNAVMILSEDQTSEHSELSKMIQSLIRSLPEDDVDTVIHLLSEAVTGGVSLELFCDLAKSGDTVPMMLAFFVKYSKENPAGLEGLCSVATQLGMDYLPALLSKEVLEAIRDKGVEWVLKNLGSKLIAGAFEVLSGLKLVLGAAALGVLLGTIISAAVLYDQIEIVPGDAPPRVSLTSRYHKLYAYFEQMLEAADALNACRSNLQSIASEVRDCKLQDTLGFHFNHSIEKQAKKLETQGRILKQLENALRSIEERYQGVEKQLLMQ